MTTNGVLTIEPVKGLGAFSLTSSLLQLVLIGRMMPGLSPASSLDVADMQYSTVQYSSQVAKQRTAGQPIAGPRMAAPHWRHQHRNNDLPMNGDCQAKPSK